MRARAPHGHEVPTTPPFILTEGDPVTVGERATRWPAFVFVESPRGSGWVPSRYLSADSGPAVVEVGYDTTELALAPGQEVTVIDRDDESGWWWCRADSGATGWVPIEALVTID